MTAPLAKQHLGYSLVLPVFTGEGAETPVQVPMDQGVRLAALQAALTVTGDLADVSVGQVLEVARFILREQ